MIKIQGQLIRKPRAQIPAPNDGVHRNGSDGFLKGAHCVYIDGKIMAPHGQVSIYYYTGGDRGLKIYYSAKHGWRQKKKKVFAARNRMRKFSHLAPKVYDIIQVEVDFNYKDRVKYKGKVWALEVEHCFWPEDWEDYCNGIPLTWCGGKYPNYSPEGYKKFKKKVDKALRPLSKKEKEIIGSSYKIGDITYCTQKQRWFMIDWG